MRLRKVFRARVFHPTTRKQSALKHLWNSWKRALSLKRDYGTLRSETDLPSYYCREISWKVKEKADAPVGLPKDAFNLKEGGAFAPWFISIPTPEGRVRLPLRMGKEHSSSLKEVEVRDSLLIKRHGEFYVHMVVEKEIPDPVIPTHAPVLAVDIGEKVIATSVALVDDQIHEPKFYGRKVRGIRRHHAWLRKRLGERKLLRVIRRVSDTEHRKVDDLLHKIARSIVDRAKELGGVIALGDLSGVRRRRIKGRRSRRIVNAMPFSRLSRFIEYKAAWDGVPVILVREDYGSQECHLCHEWGGRPTQGRFVCLTCGEYNTDLNGAVNIGKRVLRYMRITGAPGFEPVRGASF